MTWKIHDKEFQSVLSLPAPRRYIYFIKHVADQEEIWSLWGEDGWILAGDDEGHELVPVWPHPRYAEACASQWEGTASRSITLSDWLDKWTPGMIRDHRLVAVFPLPSIKGVVVPPEQLKDDIEEELSRIE